MPENSSAPAYGMQKLDYSKADILMEVTSEIESRWRRKACSKEPWTVSFIEAIPEGGWFIDVGANTGPYTLIAVARGVRVAALEPGYENYRALCHNLALNNSNGESWLDKAIPLCLAASDKTGFDYFNYRRMEPGEAYHKMGLLNKPNGFHRQIVPTITLDALVRLLPTQGAPLFVKVDVDGHEMPVLYGMADLLAGDQLKALLLETGMEVEEESTKYLNSFGWQMTQRWDAESEGDASRFSNMFYGLWQKAAA